MADRIKLDPEILKQKSKIYDESCEDIINILNKLTATQTELQEIWEGEAMYGFESQFMQLKPEVQKFSDLMCSIGIQLRETAKKYEEFDLNLKSSFGFNQ